MDIERKSIGPLPIPPNATNGWKKYVEREFSKEDLLLFNEEELEVVQQIINKLDETNEAYKWHSLGTENHRMFVRGYWERKDAVGDIVTSTLATYKYREDYNVASMFTQRLPNHDMYHSSWPSYIAGEDGFGHFVNFERVAELKLSVLDKFEKDDLLRYRAQHLEALMRVKEGVSNHLNRRVGRYIFILDLKGFSMTKNFTPRVKALLQPLFSLSGDRYPETLWSMYLVNTPTLFRMVWKAISGLVDPVVRAKIKILGGKKDFLPVMQKQGLPLESIPKILGGEAELTLMSDVIDALIDTADDRVCTEQFTTFTYFPRDKATVNENVDEDNLSLESSILRQIGNDIPPSEEELSTITHQKADAAVVEAVDESFEDILFKGYLEKRGWYNTSWRRRFFILRPSGLYYYSEEPKTEEDQIAIAHPVRGKIDLLLITAVSPMLGSQRNRGASKWASSSVKATLSRRDPLQRIKMSVRRRTRTHTALSSFRSFSITQGSPKENDTSDADGSGGIKNTESQRSSGTMEEDFIVGFDISTPYRTYKLKVSDKDLRAQNMDSEAYIGKWVDAITQANNDRLQEMEELMKDEREIYKGFLDRKVSRRIRIFGSRYRKRYFVLTSRRLYYFSDINTNIGAVLKGKIDLKKVNKCVLKTLSKKELEEQTALDVGNIQCHFELHLARLQVIPLRADDPEDAVHWVEIINTAIEDRKKAKAAKKLSKKGKSRFKSMKRMMVGARLEELIIDEEAEEEIKAGQEEAANPPAVPESETSSRTESSRFSAVSMTGSVKGMVTDALAWGKELRIFKEQEDRSVPSVDEMFTNVRSFASRLTGPRTNPPSGTRSSARKADAQRDVEEVEVEHES